MDNNYQVLGRCVSSLSVERRLLALSVFVLHQSGEKLRVLRWGCAAGMCPFSLDAPSACPTLTKLKTF